jgi:hypothetical protein
MRTQTTQQVKPPRLEALGSASHGTGRVQQPTIALAVKILANGTNASISGLPLC